MPVLTSVITHATGDVYPASDWNTYQRDNINYLIAAGADLASATTIIPTNEFHAVTGVTTIDNLTPATPVAGQRIRLWIKGGPLTIRNNGGGTGNIRTATGGDRLLATNAIIEFAYDATNTVWRETGPAGTAPVKYSTLIDIVSSVTETDILQAAGYAIPGNTLGANGDARVTLHGDYLNNTGGTTTLRIKVYWGGVLAIDTGVSFAITASAIRRVFALDLLLSNLGATNSQFISGTGILGEAGSGGTGIGSFDDLTGGGLGQFIDLASNGTLAVDTTTAATVRVTATLGSAAATHELRVRKSLIEFS